MKKNYRITDIDCPVCAGKIEAGIRAIEGVTFCALNFLAESLVIEAPDDRFDGIFKKALAVCKRVEPDCCVTEA